MKFDLDALAALDALVRTGSVAGAAQALHKVGSAVSYQVRKLEEQLRLPLLDRSGYRLRLTPAGEAVLAEGRRLLQQAQQLESLAQQLASGWEARLLLVVDGILPLADSLLALKTLADEGAPTRVQLTIEFLGGVQQRFEREQADLMLVKDYRPTRCRPGLGPAGGGVPALRGRLPPPRGPGAGRTPGGFAGPCGAGRARLGRREPAAPQ